MVLRHIGAVAPGGTRHASPVVLYDNINSNMHCNILDSLLHYARSLLLYSSQR